MSAVFSNTCLCPQARRPRALLGTWPALACALALLSPAVGHAASTTATFNVTATVRTVCAVSAGDVLFGDYDPGAAVDKTASASISVTCSLLTPYSVSLDSGTHAQGNTRQMGSGSARLEYQLYSDPAMTGVFGLVSSLLGVSGLGTGLPIAVPVYAKLPKNQNVAAGSYSDQITVTVDY